MAKTVALKVHEKTIWGQIWGGGGPGGIQALDRGQCAQVPSRFAVRTPDDLAQVHGLVLPGGESTTISRLLRSGHLQDTVVSRAVALIAERTVVALDGTRLHIDADTMCIHGDTPGSDRLAAAIRAGLEAAGIAVKPIGAP